MLKVYKLAFNLIFLAGFITQNYAMSCTLTMGYRSNERLPLINKQPSNSGLYQHLYKIAAEDIGCELQIERGPKKRILKKLKQGSIDFYPGFNFTKERAESIFYIANGLPGGDVGVSRDTFETITDLRKLKGRTLITALGAANHTDGMEGINIRKVREMSVGRAIELIRKNRGDFYIYNKSSLLYYMNRQNIKGIKIHPDCCGGMLPLYLGFSKKSAHYKMITNKDFDQTKTLSISNYPVNLDKSSIAYQFEQALKNLKNNGKTEELYDQYYQEK